MEDKMIEESQIGETREISREELIKNFMKLGNELFPDKFIYVVKEADMSYETRERMMTSSHVVGQFGNILKNRENR